MTRRSLTILLHWSLAILLLAMIKGGTAAVGVRWAYVILGGLWVGMAVANGVMARPGPKLTGAFRRGFHAAHVGIFALIAVTVVLNLGALLHLTPLVWAWNSLLVLFAATMLHAVFHLWRHTALMDGALRMITPRVLHKHL